MNKLKSIAFIALLALTSTTGVFASPSMRRCMLLPIRDGLDGSLAFKVFEMMENYLKDSDWCFYQSNSEIINILSNHKLDLDQVLQNKEVLQVVSQKSEAGSLVQIKITNQVEGVNVSIKIMGANGEDIFFQKKAQVGSGDHLTIVQTLKKWLNKYSSNIPYHGRVLGILGDQFTADIGRVQGLGPSMKVIIKRPVVKKKHPLLKEIVDWKTIDLAEGEIVQADRTQAMGKIRQYYGQKQLKVGDWVIVMPPSEGTSNLKSESWQEMRQPYQFGKLGLIKIFSQVGRSSATSSEMSGQSKKLGGPLFGIELDTTLWATRNYWGSFKLEQKFAKLEGGDELSKNSHSVSISNFDLRAGYKYLPINFFYGPQLDFFVGYANYSFGLETSASDNFSKVKFNGPLLGMNGSLPVVKKVRLGLGLNFIFNPSYREEANLSRSPNSASIYNMSLDGSFLYAPNLMIEGALSMTVGKAKFDNSASLETRETMFKVGTSFTF